MSQKKLLFFPFALSLSKRRCRWHLPLDGLPSTGSLRRAQGERRKNFWDTTLAIRD
jgi:hypothetical protein